MKIEKEYLIDHSSDKVWAFIQDREKFAKCIPDMESVEFKDEKNFNIILRPKLAFLKGKLELNCKVVSMGKKKGTLKITGKSLGSKFEAKSELSLKDKGNKTSLTWKVDVKLEGLLKPVPESVINATASVITDKLVENMKSSLK